jgi:hypothetical protein
MRRAVAIAAVGCALAAGLVLAGCASDDVGPSPAERRAQWDAQNVYPKTYKASLLDFLRTYLNDPRHVRDGGVSQPVLMEVGPGKRYVACVRYNARDDDGHYKGAKIGAATYVSGQLDNFIPPGAQAKAMCKDATFAPFPELAKLTR